MWQTNVKLEHKPLQIELSSSELSGQSFLLLQRHERGIHLLVDLHVNWAVPQIGALVGKIGLVPFVIQSGVKEISSIAMSPR